MTRVASNPFTIQVQSAGAQTGLDFPSNGAAPTNVPVAFQFLNPQLNGLPIWGPNNQGVTYIWRCFYRQQSSYYTAFFWGNYGNYIWDGGGANTYYGAHPYPINPPNGNTHNWEISVQWIETALASTGPVRMLSTRADQFFRDITDEQKARLPRYKGDLLLTEHSAGSLTSQAYMKRWNRMNEVLVEAAEKASVAPRSAPRARRLTAAAIRGLPGSSRGGTITPP